MEGSDMNAHTRRERIFAALDGVLEGFLVTDRKEDKVLPLGEIEGAVRDWDVTVPELVFYVEEWLRRRIPVGNVSDDTIEEPERTGKSWTRAPEEEST
jgi:hypothetical protein